MTRTNVWNDYVVAMMPDGAIVAAWTGRRYKNYDPAQHVTQYRISCAHSGHDAIQRALAIRQQVSESAHADGTDQAV